MKIKRQKAIFPNKELRKVISNQKPISKNWFGWNVLNHPQKDLWVPLYIKALEDQLHTKYKDKASKLLIKFVRLHERMLPTLDLPIEVSLQVERVALTCSKMLQKDSHKNKVSPRLKEKAIKQIERLHLPLSDFHAKGNDKDFMEALKAFVSAYTKNDQELQSLRTKLKKNMNHSYDQERIVDLPNCPKAHLIPHPYSEKQIGLYFNSVLQHKVPVLVTLCSPYEDGEILPFWEDRVVEDPQGRSIKCTLVNETVRYQSPDVAVIEDKTRAKRAVKEGGIAPHQFFPRIVERRLLLQRGDESYETVHLHYENWPDHQEAPDIEALRVLFERRDSLCAPDDVFMVNCKATIGRSGVFFFSDYGRKLVTAMHEEGVPFSEMKLNFADLVCQARRFRPILSGNATQMGQAMKIIGAHFEALKAQEP